MKNRTPEEILQHYKLETRLADKLRHSNFEERKRLYSDVYNEFITKLDHLPQLNLSLYEKKAKVLFEMVHLLPFLDREFNYLELGAGDCALAREVSYLVKGVFIGEVSGEIINKSKYPNNFKFIRTDGRNIDLPDSIIDVAYSHQLMEHIHPDDAVLQLKSILRVLKPGGVYICITPNRLNGPHDISKYFDEEAKGFHLKEYTVTELTELFKEVGFKKVKAYVKIKKFRLFWPLFIIRNFERMLSMLNFKTRIKFARNALVGTLIFINVIGEK